MFASARYFYPRAEHIVNEVESVEPRNGVPQFDGKSDNVNASCVVKLRSLILSHCKDLNRA